MPKLGDIVTYVTDQGNPRMAFVSAEVVEPAKEEDEPIEEKKARERDEAEEKKRLDKEKKHHDKQQAVQMESARAAHKEAEAHAGGPIQRVTNVAPEPPSPIHSLPHVDEEDETTGPELTLHAFLQLGDVDYTTYGAIATYSGVRHSNEARPNTWH